MKYEKYCILLAVLTQAPVLLVASACETAAQTQVRARMAQFWQVAEERVIEAERPVVSEKVEDSPVRPLRHPYSVEAVSEGASSVPTVQMEQSVIRSQGSGHFGLRLLGGLRLFDFTWGEDQVLEKDASKDACSESFKTPDAWHGTMPCVTMALLAGAIGAFFFGMGPANPLLFRIGDLENGRWWTLWTSHGVHFSASHLFWDALAVGVLGRCLEGQLGARRTLALLALAAPGVAYGTLCLEPGVVGYGGLSGLACVLAGGLMVTFGRGAQRERQVAWFLGLLLAAKIGWEFINRGEAIFVARVAAPTVVVPWAHALGAMLGAGLVGGTFCLAAMRERFRGGGEGLLSDEACGLKSGHDAVPCER